MKGSLREGVRPFPQDSMGTLTECTLGYFVRVQGASPAPGIEGIRDEVVGGSVIDSVPTFELNYNNNHGFRGGLETCSKSFWHFLLYI